MKSSRKLIIKPISLLMGVALLLMTHAAYAITVSYTYDELGRLTNAAYSNNNFISYTYDSVGNITDITTSGDVDAPVVSTAQNITVAATDANGTEASHAQITAFLTAATASDVIDGQLAPSNNATTTFPLGTTTVTFSATDSSNNTGTAQATVTVTDQTKPIISLTGNSSITLNIGDSYSDQGATAIDNVDGDKTAAIQTSSTVNTAQVGQHTVTYTVSDAAGNAATAVTRSITVQDADAPVVSTAQNITVAATDANGTEASNAQITVFLTAATANDNVDGTLTPTNNAPTTFPLGTTTVTFSATDSNNNNTGTAQATVTVTDQTKPIITLTGNSSITLNIGDSYTDQGATAEDNVDGNITANILVSNTVNINVVNTYSVTYSVSDAVGNATTPVIRQVSIIELDLNQIDTDGDGVNDNVDTFINDAAASVDTDEDGQPDTINGTSTTGLIEDLDDDNDGVNDGSDAFPIDGTETLDTDGDGTGNNADLDDDNDGVSDLDEIANGTDPLDSNSGANGSSPTDLVSGVSVVDANAVTTPNGGEVWLSGTSQNVTWNNQLITGSTVELYVLHDDPSGLFDANNQTQLNTVINAKNWNHFAQAVPNTGSYHLDPALMAGSGNAYVAMVVSSQDKSIFDIGNGMFTLGDNSLITSVPQISSIADLSINEGDVIHLNNAASNLEQYVNDTDTNISNIQFSIVNANTIDTRFGLSIGMSGAGFEVRSDNSIHAHPAADFSGETVIQVQVKDPEGNLSNVVSFTITINETVVVTDSDGDGVEDIDDDFINDASGSIDTDRDGRPDKINGVSTTGLVEDVDDDEDGIPDANEIAAGLNPLDDSDATADTDGDGTNNLAEYNNGSLGIDDVSPIFTAPNDLNTTASGFLTAVDLRGIEVVDSKDGVLSAQVDKTGPFKSGRHIITWIVRDQAGNATTDTQIVNITPLVRLPIDLIVGEGTRISIPIVLSGLAVHYPVVMNYTIGGTADGNDHNAINGDISIEEGKQTELTIKITDDVVADPNETIVITLSNPQNAALTSDTQMQITIVEENIAPIANFITNQNGMATRRVNRLDGNVTINSNVLDPNANEVHSYDWSLTDNNLVDIDNDDSTFTFDPTNIAPGLYQIALKVTDSDGLRSQIARTIRVFAAVITLSTEQDTDGDGISDAVEGSGDSDGDGIADYQDDASQPINVMPLPSGKTMEVADGLQIKVGHNAFGGNGKTATTTLEDISNYGSAAVGITTTDNDFTPQSIIFDFAISGLAQPGDKASIVMPLETPLPANAIYRKFLANEGWVTLAKGDDYNIESALSEAVSGLCPDVNSNVFTDGLTEGDDCIKLTLVDGGRFDGDGSVNGVIEDPGVIVTDKAEDTSADVVTEDTSANVVTDGISVSSGGGGGAMSYKLFLLMFFLYVLGHSINRKRLNTYFF